RYRTPLHQREPIQTGLSGISAELRWNQPLGIAVHARGDPESTHDGRRGAVMTRLHQLYEEQRQSPWLDNLTRPYLRDGTLAGFVRDGVRGVTANPTTLAKAMEG